MTALLLPFWIGLWVAVLLCYLRSPHQRLLSRPLLERHGLMLSLALALLSWLWGAWQVGPLVAVLAGLAWALLWASAWPLLALCRNSAARADIRGGAPCDQ